MRQNFSVEIILDGKTLVAVLLPHLRHNGLHYEVNVRGFPRFFMKKTELGRYDIVTPNAAIPYNLILAASDVIETRETHF